MVRLALRPPGARRRAQLRMVMIPNTLELAELWASPALLEEARKHPHLKVEGDARPLPLDPTGTLRQEELFPHSVRGRRGNAGIS